MKKIYIIFFSLLFIMISCTPEIEKNRREYIIENNTDYKLDIRFYDSFNSKLNQQLSKVLFNRGERLMSFVEQTSNFNDSENYLFRAYNADSIRIIFDENKVFTIVYNVSNQTFSDPISRNLFRHSNYQNLGSEQYIFKVNQEDYDNAEDCNSNCD